MQRFKHCNDVVVLACVESLVNKGRIIGLQHCKLGVDDGIGII